MMRKIDKSAAPKGNFGAVKTKKKYQNTNEVSESNGQKSSVQELESETRSLDLKPTLLPDSVTPFPNIDQVKSESTNLIDESTKQLKELMSSISRTVVMEENLFKSVNHVNAACNCAKQISALLRVKLDIYKEYKKGKNV